VLLLKNGGLVKTIRFKNPTYIGDPINAVKIFNEKEVDEIVLPDITSDKEKIEPDYSKVKEIVLKHLCLLPMTVEFIQLIR